MALMSESQKEVFNLAKVTSRVSIAGEKVQFRQDLEHVGITRSANGNSLHIANRIAAHKRVIGALASAGLSRHHRGNPAGLRVLKRYGSGVLFSGVASLVLSKPDISLLDNHYKAIVQSLQQKL